MKSGIINNGAKCYAPSRKDTVITERPWTDIKAIKWNKKGKFFHVSRTYTKKQTISENGVVTVTYIPSPGKTYDPNRVARIAKLKELN